jgi:hypothetical protein
MNTAQLDGFGRPVAFPEKPRRTIPFDYAFRFDKANKNELKGQPGFVHNSTVEVSVEATFTAVSIGYGVVPKAQPITFGLPPPARALRAPINLFSAPMSDIIQTLSAAFDEEVKSPQPAVSTPPVAGTPPSVAVASLRFLSTGLPAAVVPPVPRTIKLGPKTAAVLQGGLRLNPEFADRILLTGGANLDARILQEAFQAVGAPPEQIAFKYAIFDQGSGREFQSDPILNIAGLGSADGKRPFRYFARPIEFAPRSTIRLEITEVSTFEGELHISLQGYKTLGQAGTPTGSSQQHHRRTRR